MDSWKIANTTASAVIDYIGTAENMRADAVAHAEHLAAQSRTFQMMALGRADELSAKQLAQIKIAAMKAGAGKEAYLNRATELEKFIGPVPQSVRSRVSSYYRKDQLRGPQTGGARAARVALSKLPYAASALTAGTELWNAYKGEQTWGKAVARTGGVLAGGAAGAEAGALVGSSFGVPGALIGSVGGGVVGGIAGSEVVDYFIPDGEEQFPSAVEKAAVPEDLDRAEWEQHRRLPFSPYKSPPGT
ncbi:MAG: hypothetical protein GEU97_18415 [Actinophytocola sp.]|nr:hypothetical protein [Actinophytocola sp.]